MAGAYPCSGRTFYPFYSTDKCNFKTSHQKVCPNADLLSSQSTLSYTSIFFSKMYIRIVYSTYLQGSLTKKLFFAVCVQTTSPPDGTQLLCAFVMCEDCSWKTGPKNPFVSVWPKAQAAAWSWNRCGGGFKGSVEHVRGLEKCRLYGLWVCE